jgi:hypothetical protein
VEIQTNQLSATEAAKQQAAILEKAKLKLEKKRLTLEQKRQKKGS